MRDSAFYVIDIDHKNKVVTLGFLQERFVAHNLDELKILADVTGQLNQDLTELLSCDLSYDSREADCKAIDLTEITSQHTILCDKHKPEQCNVS